MDFKMIIFLRTCQYWTSTSPHDHSYQAEGDHKCVHICSRDDHGDAGNANIHKYCQYCQYAPLGIGKYWRIAIHDMHYIYMDNLEEDNLVY